MASGLFWSSLVLIGLGGIMTAPSSARGQPAPSGPMCQRICASKCRPRWIATVCANETFSANTWTETIELLAQPGQPAVHLVEHLGPGAHTVDIAASAGTSAGSLALVGIGDLDRFAQAPLPDGNPGWVALTPVAIACRQGMAAQPDCDAAKRSFFDGAGVRENLQSTAAWWHACVNASDNVAKTITGQSVGAWGLLLGAVTEANSAASLRARVTHHVAKPQQRVQWSCASETGDIAAGDYAGTKVGQVEISAPRKHGGTLSNRQVFIEGSDSVVGSLWVDPTGAITFEGRAEDSACLSTCRENCAGLRPGDPPRGPLMFPLPPE